MHQCAALLRHVLLPIAAVGCVVIEHFFRGGTLWCASGNPSFSATDFSTISFIISDVKEGCNGRLVPDITVIRIGRCQLLWQSQREEFCRCPRH